MSIDASADTPLSLLTPEGDVQDIAISQMFPESFDLNIWYEETLAVCREIAVALWNAASQLFPSTYETHTFFANSNGAMCAFSLYDTAIPTASNCCSGSGVEIMVYKLTEHFSLVWLHWY